MAKNFDDSDLFAALDLENDDLLQLDDFDDDVPPLLNLEAEPEAFPVSKLPEPSAPARRVQPQSGGGWKRVVLIVLAILVVAALAVAGKFAWDRFHPADETTPPVTETVQPTTTPEAEPTTEPVTETEPVVETQPAVETESAQEEIASTEPVTNTGDNWELFLVNDANPLTTDPALTLSYVNTMGVEQSESEFMVDARIVNPLSTMMADCMAATGGNLRIASAYRTMARQQELWTAAVENRGSEEAASLYSSRPGTSDLETGLCVNLYDIYAEDAEVVYENFEESPEYAWLMENARNYGFIQRYPEGKSEFTGKSGMLSFFRYVGVDHAAAIWDSGMCLEEYVAQLAAPEE